MDTKTETGLSVLVPVIAGAKAIIDLQDWKISKNLKEDGLGAQVSLTDYDIHYLLMDSVLKKLSKRAS